jgi:signal peptidase I
MRAAFISFLALGVIAGALIAVTIYGRGYRRFVVGKTSCMSPTINSGELIFVKDFALKRDALRRYQIILFRSPLPIIPNEKWVMRVIGLPGEQVEIRTNSFLINGSDPADNELPAVLRKKQWLPAQVLKSSRQRQWSLGPGEVFVVGDNLGAAHDSRLWGPLSFSNVIGVVEKKAKGKQTEVRLDFVLPIRTTITVQKGDPRAVDNGK